MIHCPGKGSFRFETHADTRFTQEEAREKYCVVVSLGELKHAQVGNSLNIASECEYN